MPSMTRHTGVPKGWKCPRCETINTGSSCRVCGRERPMRKTTRKTGLVPEDKLLHQAHKAAVLRIGETIPFFIVVWLVNWVLSFLIGWLFGLMFALGGVLIAEAIYKIFLGNIFEYGEHIAGLHLYRDEDLNVATLFEGMHDYGRTMAGMFWIKLRIGLWMLVPVFGYVKQFSYMLAPYVLYDNPGISAEDALKCSAELTHGHKMEMFVRRMKFLGWDVLNLLSFNLVGLMYYFALYDTVWAGFYDELRKPRTEDDYFGRDTEEYHDVLGDVRTPTSERDSKSSFSPPPEL